MTSTEQRIAQAVDRTQTRWSVFMVVAVILTFIFLPIIWLLALIPIGFITYYGSLSVMAWNLTKELNSETWSKHALNVEKLNELHARLEAGDIQPGEELVRLLRESGLTEMAPVMELGPEIGVFQDHKMYDWVSLTNPDTEETHRYEYSGPLAVDAEGNLLNAKDGFGYTIVDGIVYERALTAEPEQTDAE